VKLFAQPKKMFVLLGKPLNCDRLAVRIGKIDYLLQPISPYEMAAILDSKEKEGRSAVFAVPRYVCFAGDIVCIWPVPDKRYELVRAPPQ
jgi:hypothetical protein